MEAIANDGNQACQSVSASKDKVVPFDLLHAELFYPTRMQKCQTTHLPYKCLEEVASTILAELHDPQKVSSTYLSCQLRK